jgi:hypothetical protein
MVIARIVVRRMRGGERRRAAEACYDCQKARGVSGLSRWVAGIGFIGGAAAAVAVVAACLPDLAAVAPPAVPGPGCGDGFIDLDAGEQCDPGETGAPGCKACVVDCPGGYVDDASNHCYFRVGDGGDFPAANAACALSNGHVVTFASNEELQRVYAWAKATTSTFWVDLINTGGNSAGSGWTPQMQGQDREPGWTSTCSGCFAETPLDAGGGQCAVARATQQLWAPSGCPSVRNVLCEREPPGDLAQICNGAICIALRKTFGTKRYLYIAQEATADDARSFCESLDGGHLVILRTAEEREQLWHGLAALASPPSQFWIGLSRDDGGAWAWDDRTSVDAAASQWAANQPSAAGIDRAYVWQLDFVADSQLAHNTGDGGPLPFVCEEP